MNLFLQFGHGMMGHTKELLGHWKGKSGVVLSPRDLEQGQLATVAQQAAANGGEVLLDPQCFMRHADHERLTSHDYWQANRDHSTASFLSGEGVTALLRGISELSLSLGVRRHILPGTLAADIDDDWFALQESFVRHAPQHFGRGERLATIALSADVMASEEKIEAVVERAGTWDVAGFYVVAETPSQYLVDDPNWLANLLILVAGLKLHRRAVIVGYSNHQSLCLAAADADAICSGTWLNVRAFPPEKFFLSSADEVSRRAKGGWYYCPQALSEYTMPFLDIAKRTGCLDPMSPVAPIPEHYCKLLFAGAQPTSVSWGESNAFRHYLDTLRAQCVSLRGPTFDATEANYIKLLDDAESTVARLQDNGVRGRDRDFGGYIDATRSALVVFKKALAPRLRRRWS